MLQKTTNTRWASYRGEIATMRNNAEANRLMYTETFLKEFNRRETRNFATVATYHDDVRHQLSDTYETALEVPYLSTESLRPLQEHEYVPTASELEAIAYLARRQTQVTVRRGKRSFRAFLASKYGLDA